MSFSKLSVALTSLLATTALAAPSLSPRSCPHSFAWGDSTIYYWDLLGYETYTGSPSVPITQFEFEGNCPPGGSFTFAVLDKRTCKITTSETIVSIDLGTYVPAVDVSGNGKSPLTLTCPSGGYFLADIVFAGHVQAAVDANTVWQLIPA